MRRPAGFLLLVLLGLCAPARAASESAPPVALEPRPQHVEVEPGCKGPAPGALLSALGETPLDPAARELIQERWRALGVAPGKDRRAVLSVVRGSGPAHARPQSYSLSVDPAGVRVESADADGEFYAFATLAQLVRRGAEGYALPCVRIDDAPALRWRILSDDVSRGPLPTMQYFEERIRTLAAFKMNGYSPYFEQVFVDPKHPLPAPADGITPGELRRLALYAARFHVALIPEQQTFAHMHEALRWEKYAPLAELPHGYLLAPANPDGDAYVRDLIGDELAAVPHPPFFHIGSDEPSDLGRGLSHALVAEHGLADTFADHVLRTLAFVTPSGARPMIWDDAVQAQPQILRRLPKSLVIVDWHYGNEPSYEHYIKTVANAGFEQMVAPGDDNWNEIYPNLDDALPAIDRFVGEGKSAHVLGLFQTVWHDDGETLYDATWFPVLYAAASAWETGSVPRERFEADFPHVFFGSEDAGFAHDVAALARCRTLLAGNPRRAGDPLFWADPFDDDVRGLAKTLDVSGLRRSAESVLEHLRTVPPPPLHPNAALVMQLAARRYDALGRSLQIAQEARDYYEDGRAKADGTHENLAFRGLFIAKYLFWEERDTLLGLQPLVRSTWEYESRTGHEASVLERYRIAADRALDRADRIAAATSKYAQKRTPRPDIAAGLGLRVPPCSASRCWRRSPSARC